MAKQLPSQALFLAISLTGVVGTGFAALVSTDSSRAPGRNASPVRLQLGTAEPRVSPPSIQPAAPRAFLARGAASPTPDSSDIALGKSPEAPVAQDAMAPGVERTTKITGAVRELHDPISGRRIDALRLIRDGGLFELSHDVERLAFQDPDPIVRRFAVQALAVDPDVAGRRDMFLALAKADDWTIRANALYGLSRGGDEEAQTKLVELARSFEQGGNRCVDGLTRALASPEIHGATVIAYFNARATDPQVSEEDRAEYGRALCMKTLAAKAPR
jgi:hypothetical protein